MSFKLKVPWTRQPQYPVELSAFGKSIGVLSAWNLVNPAHDAGGLGGLTASGVLPFAAGRYGRGYEFTGTPYFLGPERPEYGFGTGDFFILAVCRGNASAAIDMLVAKSHATIANNLYFGFSTTNTLRAECAGAAAINSTSVWSDNKDHICMVTRRAGVIEFYVDGVYDGGGTSAGSIGSLGQITLAKYGTVNAFQLNGNMYLAVIGNKAPPAGVCKSLTINPWQIYQPLSRNIYVESAAASDSGAGSSSGLATVSGTGASTAASPASSAGIAAVSGVGASTTRGVGASDGIAAVSGIGAATGSATGASDGIAAVSGTGISTAASTGASAGVAVVSGVGASTVASVGSSVGVATVIGISPDTASQFSGGFLDYGENARIKRREIEAREAVEKAQDVEIISVKPVSQIEPTNKKRQDRLDKAIALATQENSELRALNIERDVEIKNLLLVEQAIRNEDEEVLMLYAATLRQPMQIAA